MVRIRKTNDIILSTIEFYSTAQPQLDVKPGAVARDLLVDGPATQLARLYEELARVRNAQSLRSSLGNDVDRWGDNFGVERNRGSRSSGVALFTFNEIESDVSITTSDIVRARNGATFNVTNNITVSADRKNQLRATASRFRSNLDLAGITDEFAVEVNLEATTPGTLGNISKFSLINTSTPGVSNVTNVSPFGGGSSVESENAFKQKILSTFSGANTGTRVGYRNAVKKDPAVLDSVVIEPGDPLMTRDGTQVSIAEDGTRTIISEGTGGKVDVLIFGLRLVEVLDSFIFRDKSNKDDPTDPANDFVLGQIEEDENKTVIQKRIDNIEAGQLPQQPVNDIIEVSGSISGANFLPKSVDNLGRISGNFELIRDDGAFGGSPWGFDKLSFISDRIKDFQEELNKSRFNGKDGLNFPDVLKIGNVQQDIQVVNENSKVDASNRASIQLSHFPAKNVTRVFNLTTGERYVISDQNPDGTGGVNNTGRILIRGNTLPSVNDILQVDYTWAFEYDNAFDYDNKLTNKNPREAVDSIDWGFSNSVSREQSNVEASNGQLIVNVAHTISSVISVNTFETEDNVSVQLVSGRLAVVVSKAVENVVSVVRDSDGAELFDTSNSDGSFSGMTIFLPTDTVAIVGDVVDVVYNANDVFIVDGVNGSFSSNTITLPSSTSVIAGTLVEVNYISNIRTILPVTALSNLPAVREGNRFNTSASNDVGIQPTTHIFSGDNIVKNLREAPSRLQLSISGNVSPGVITVSGTSIKRVSNSVLTVSSAGLKHDLSAKIKEDLGLASSASVPSTVKLAKIVSAEKVTTTSSLEVLSSDHSFDIENYKLRNNDLSKDESISDSSLNNTEFELPLTSDNDDNAPNVGDRLRVTFYYTKDGDSENTSFSRSGTLFTNKKFAFVDTVSISSGFTSTGSQSATLTISNMNQPTTGSRYNAFYDYEAPKTNERISIRYNHNSLITDSAFSIENVRPLGADVLPKAASPILVDATFRIVVSEGFRNSTSVVIQNVRDAIVSALNANSLGTIIDSSDLIGVANSIDGVDRIRTIFFNKTGETGSVLSISAQKNKFIQANNIVVETEER